MLDTKAVLTHLSLRTVKHFSRICKVFHDYQSTRVETNDSFTETLFDKVSYFYIYAILGCKVKGMKIIVEADWPLKGWHTTFQQDIEDILIYQVDPEASAKTFNAMCHRFFAIDTPSILVLPVNKPWTTLPEFKTGVKPVYVLTLDTTTPTTVDDSSTRPYIIGRLRLQEVVAGGWTTWTCASIEEKTTVKELVCVRVGALKSFSQDGNVDVTYRPKVPIEHQVKLVSSADDSRDPLSEKSFHLLKAMRPVSHQFLIKGTSLSSLKAINLAIARQFPANPYTLYRGIGRMGALLDNFVLIFENVPNRTYSRLDIQESDGGKVWQALLKPVREGTCAPAGWRSFKLVHPLLESSNA